MNLMIELLANAHEADLRRESHQRRLKEIATGCRRRQLGILPAGPACDPQAC